MALAVAGVLVVYNNLVKLLPLVGSEALYVPVRLAIGCLLLLWARRRGFSWGEMGFSTQRIGDSLKWGLGLGLALVAPAFLALALPEEAVTLEDPRVGPDVSYADLAFRTLVRIPLGTALFEEVAFRGVLYGVWARQAGIRWAFVGSALAFALWHVRPTFELMEGIDVLSNPFLLALGVLGGVLATVLAGLFFNWLRLKTGGIYGPVLTHWLVNALGALAAFLYAR